MTKLTRRELLKATALPLAAAVVKTKPARRNVIVVGAGAFGGWTALQLLRGGARVTLIDAWGPGNARSSSGGETRVIRSIYGGDRDYIQWVARSFALWRDFPQIYRRTGALWMFAGDDSYAKSSLSQITTRIDHLSLDAARTRYPQVDFSGISSVYLEHEAGYLFARRGCQVVQEAFVRAGGTYRLEQIPSPSNVREISKRADAVVFACGPWLGKMFPDFIGNAVAPSRQEVFFFGTDGGDRRFLDFPVWVDFSDRVFYGVAGNEHRGFKVADDTRGDPVDPTTLDRRPSEEGLARVRAKLAQRFPSLARAPLLEARVCQYENSPDGHFIIDRHPDAANVFIAGGGSGHGYKLGPALGEFVSDVVLEKKKLMDRFRLTAERKQKAPATQMEHA